MPTTRNDKFQSDYETIIVDIIIYIFLREKKLYKVIIALPIIVPLFFKRGNFILKAILGVHRVLK